MATVASQEDVVNLALARIGAATISDLDNDTTREAVLARVLYYNVRDSLLRAHHWSFATQRAQLTDSGTDPTFGWDNAFVLPTDFVRIVDVFASNSLSHRIPYKIENQNITTGTAAATDHKLVLCNSSDCYIIYIFQQTDVTKWTYDFQDAVGWMLASELSRALVGSNPDWRELRNEGNRALSRAKAVDGIEDYPDELAWGTWLTERGGTNSGRWGDE